MSCACGHDHHDHHHPMITVLDTIHGPLSLSTLSAPSPSRLFFFQRLCTSQVPFRIKMMISSTPMTDSAIWLSDVQREFCDCFGDLNVPETVQKRLRQYHSRRLERAWSCMSKSELLALLHTVEKNLDASISLPGNDSESNARWGHCSWYCFHPMTISDTRVRYQSTGFVKWTSESVPDPSSVSTAEFSSRWVADTVPTAYVRICGWGWSLHWDNVLTHGYVQIRWNAFMWQHPAHHLHTLVLEMLDILSSIWCQWRPRRASMTFERFSDWFCCTINHKFKTSLYIVLMFREFFLFQAEHLATQRNIGQCLQTNANVYFFKNHKRKTKIYAYNEDAWD